MKQILFGVREDGVYRDNYPIFIKKKNDTVQIGYVSLMNKIPEVTEEKKAKDIMKGARKSRIVISVIQKYFRKLTTMMFEEIQNYILTGNKTDKSGLIKR